MGKKVKLKNLINNKLKMFKNIMLASSKIAAASFATSLPESDKSHCFNTGEVLLGGTRPTEVSLLVPFQPRTLEIELVYGDRFDSLKAECGIGEYQIACTNGLSPDVYGVDETTGLVQLEVSEENLIARKYPDQYSECSVMAWFAKYPPTADNGAKPFAAMGFVLLFDYEDLE